MTPPDDGNRPRQRTGRIMRVNRRIASFALCVVLVLVAVIGWRSVADRRLRDRIVRADPEAILADAQLRPAALAIGRLGFMLHCAACHARDGRNGKPDPSRGVPDLTDAEHLYGEGGTGGGEVRGIEQIVLHGIRSGDPRGWQLASMPAYARSVPYAAEPIPPLTPGGIGDVTQYLLQRRGRATDPTAASRGQALYRGTGGCWDCHGNDAGGDAAIGAPNLVDDVWLYGDGSAGAISHSIAQGRAGSCPAFAHVLTPTDARAIAVYTASLSQPSSRARP